MNTKKFWLLVLLATILVIAFIGNFTTGFHASVKADDAPLAQATNPLLTTSPSPQPTSPLPTPGYTPRPPMGPTLWMTPPEPVTATPLPDVTATVLPAAMALRNENSVASLSRASLVQSKWFLPLARYRISMTYDKKGIGDDWQTWIPPRPGTNFNALNFTWFYDWTFGYLPSRNEARYVRMIWCNGLWHKDINGNYVYAGDLARSDYNSGYAGRIWLVFNETDGPGQCPDPGPVAAADFYVTAYDVIKANDPTAGVFGGGMVYLNTTETQNWWTSFIDRLTSTGNLYKLQGVHVHLYPRISTSLTRMYKECPNSPYCLPELAQVAKSWYQNMHINKGLGDRPIWISETGWLGESPCSSTRIAQIRDNFMIPWSKWFAKDSSWPYNSQVGVNPGYSAIAWYVSRDAPANQECTYLLNSLGPSGAPTSLGNFWSSYQP